MQYMKIEGSMLEAVVGNNHATATVVSGRRYLMPYAVLMALLSSLLWTQVHASAADARVYEPDFFTAYQPLTALDMVGRIPGFSIDQQESRRGLGQGGANVLINGERLSGKEDPFARLDRIAAENVVKIEILDGASLDVPGLSGQVANIHTRSGGFSGTWEWGGEWRDRMDNNPGTAKVTLSGENDVLDYTLTLENTSYRNGHWGPDKLRDADGELFEVRDEFEYFNRDIPGVSFDAGWVPKAEQKVNLELKYFRFNFSGREESARSAITDRGQTLDTEFIRSEDEWNGTAGVDYEFPVADGRFKAILWHRSEHSPFGNQFSVFEAGELTQSSRFFQVADESESILRGEYSWQREKGGDWQVGLEGAFNVLDIESALSVLDNGTFVDVALDGADSRVEEERAELTLTHSRTLHDRWDIQASLGGEYSKIMQTGGLSREFWRPKGFVSASYAADNQLTWRAKAEREVGQLSFYDFISSVSLNDDLNRVGNVNLVPSQTWRGEFGFEKQFGKGNIIETTLYYEAISDLVDRIPLGDDGDAVGNIDDASRYGIDINATFKGESWGWPGFEVSLELDYRDSSVDDPLQGFSRRLNWDKKSYWQIDIRHDIPDTQWAWGLFLDQFKEAPAYRLNVIDEFTFEGPWAEAFIEHKDVYGLKVRLGLKNLADATDDFRREVYTARRDLGEFDYSEDRSREFKFFPRLTVSGSF